jgi:hypothetical protein
VFNRETSIGELLGHRLSQGRFILDQKEMLSRIRHLKVPKVLRVPKGAKGAQRCQDFDTNAVGWVW